MHARRRGQGDQEGRVPRRADAGRCARARRARARRHGRDEGRCRQLVPRRAVRRRGRVDRQRASNELADTRKTLEVREATLEFLRAPETRILNTAAPEEQKPVAKVFVNAGRGVLIVASNLPKLDAGRTYEMWVVPKAGGPRPMGLFKPNADGTATHFQAGVVNLAEAAAIALSNEPDGGSPAPTTPPFLITPVGD